MTSVMHGDEQWTHAWLCVNGLPHVMPSYPTSWVHCWARHLLRPLFAAVRVSMCTCSSDTSLGAPRQTEASQYSSSIKMSVSIQALMLLLDWTVASYEFRNCPCWMKTDFFFPGEIIISFKSDQKSTVADSSLPDMWCKNLDKMENGNASYESDVVTNKYISIRTTRIIQPCETKPSSIGNFFLRS